ncbi:MAG: M3 family oligoendopeptidase [Spirochaetes bacterium]|nr:M3 family oligoendopeptidase [Spirochaetota bacterium]
MPGSSTLPRWDLSPVFAGFDDPAYLEAKADCTRLADGTLALIGRPADGAGFGPWLHGLLDLSERLHSVGQTLGAYTYARYSVDTRDRTAMTELNVVEELLLSLQKVEVAFRNALASRSDEVERLITADPAIGAFAFNLREEMLWAKKQMSPELEDLAADLQRSGGDAWGRLQEMISSTTSAIWDEKTGERKTVIQLRNMAFDPDRSVREKAFRKELEAWKAVEVPVAAALNGVKGWTVTLNGRRGWEGALEKSVEQARITRATLDALIGAMEEAQPLFRRYLAAKARVLGIKACAFYDLFAPAGSSTKTYTFEEVSSFIVEKFGTFSAEMGAFAGKAFRENWIDAEPREGKVGGAYCIDFPLAGTARVLCNFEGSFSSLTTVAHELGHAYHHEVIKDLPILQTSYPMTLAETASIFAETVVFEDALASCTPQEKLGLLELHLQDGCQIIVDILSRFHFEREVFARRPKGELGPGEFCSLMVDAQKATYGEGLDPGALHPYMWAVKGHYYSAGLSFYNFPYAFGQLFGLGLYAASRKEGPGFAETYREILRETGRTGAVELCARVGFDIETIDFWRDGISVFARHLEEFEALAAAGR